MRNNKSKLFLPIVGGVLLILAGVIFLLNNLGMIALNWENGDGNVDATIRMEGSIDNVNFAPIDGVEQQFTDDDGTIIFDVIGLNSVFTRVTIEVTSGSFDIVALELSAKQRH